MNKVILGLILAVCLLGMALVMLNERLGRQSEPVHSQNTQVAENRSPDDLNFPEQKVDVNPPLPAAETPPVSPLPDPKHASEAEKLEVAEADAALAPPVPVQEEPARTDNPAEKSPTPPVIQPQPKNNGLEKPQPDKTVEKAPPKPLPVEKPAVQDKGKEKTVNRFVIFSRDKGATIRIGGTSRIHYTSMTLDNPDRIVVDMDGQWQFPPSPGVPKNEMVSNVRIGKNGEKTRVVIDLKEKARVVRVIPSKNGDSLDVRVDK